MMLDTAKNDKLLCGAFNTEGGDAKLKSLNPLTETARRTDHQPESLLMDEESERLISRGEGLGPQERKKR